MRWKMKGSVTVEASFLVPLIFMVIVVIISILFYYHDKNVIAGVAHETVTVCSRGDQTKEQIESYFYEQLGEKLIMFGTVDVECRALQEEVQLECTTQARGMQIYVSASMKRTRPEVRIRKEY